MTACPPRLFGGGGACSRFDKGGAYKNVGGGRKNGQRKSGSGSGYSCRISCILTYFAGFPAFCGFPCPICCPGNTPIYYTISVLYYILHTTIYSIIILLYTTIYCITTISCGLYSFIVLYIVLYIYYYRGHAGGLYLAALPDFLFGGLTIF